MWQNSPKVNRSSWEILEMVHFIKLKLVEHRVLIVKVINLSSGCVETLLIYPN